MPFVIEKHNGKYRLKKKDGTYVNVNYQTRQAAINSGLNYMRYRHEVGVVRGNKIIVKK